MRQLSPEGFFPPTRNVLCNKALINLCTSVVRSRMADGHAKRWQHCLP